jgi:arginase family enzyme
MQEQTPIVLMNFSGIYKEEEFWKKRQVSWIEVQDICGTNCYCDDEAIAEINNKIESYSVAGIHFIDSGNYHYMTRLWLAGMREPFILLVYDNHTDMQPPAFGGILSCGGWIAASLEELEYLKHVILIGPDEAAYGQVEEELKERVTFLSRERLQEMTATEINAFLRDTVTRECNWGRFENCLPLYISIDKDVLCSEDVQTTWSQGDMQLETLLSGVQTVLECAKETGGRIAGVDICGEADAEALHENEANDFANEKLLKILTAYTECECMEK